jgi:hypothetical protein
MTRGSTSKGVKGMYLNMIRSSETLDPAFQRRVHQLAKRTKDEDLAASLARRADTIDEIDTDLGSWGSAKVQSAWFARPGRDYAAVAAKLAREKRVTILEVVASLGQLPEAIYATCAKRDSLRVAFALVTNDAASVTTRRAAAATIGRQYEAMSYAKQHALVGTLASCDQEIVDAFIQACPTIETVAPALTGASALAPESVDHIYNLATEILTGLPKLHATKLAESQNRTSRHSYYGGSYDVSRPMHSVLEACKHVVVLTEYDSPRRDKLVECLAVLIELFGKKQWQYDDDLHRTASELLETVTATKTGRRPSKVDMVRSITSVERLEEVANELSNQRKLDRATAVVILCHEHVSHKAAELAVRAFGWGETTKVLAAKGKDMKLHAKAVALISTHDVNDARIAKFAAPATPSEFWMEIVAVYANSRGIIPQDVLASTHARVDIIPRLPLRIFSQEDLPGWMVTGFTELLAQELATTGAWDAFEVLAPNHLGTVTQVLRAAKLTTKHLTTTTPDAV